MKIEAIFLILVAIVVLGVLYCLFVMIFNGFLFCTTNFRIKLPVQKRFVGKKTPIYKLRYESDYKETKRLYYITKWELEYDEFDMGSILFVLVPFIAMFKRLKYVEKKTFNIGVLPDDVVATLNLEENWIHEFNKWDAKNKKEQSKNDKFNSILNNLNKDFNENYIE